jgi:hypothetical protein
MKIRQYVYFKIRSETSSAQDIAACIGLAPDRELVRGSRTESPPRPAKHAWEIHCQEPSLRIDQQIEQIVSRLDPYRAAIRSLVRDGDDADATLQAVRYFGVYLAETEGEEEAQPTRDDDLEKLPGQHQLLGWHLSHSVTAFLVDVNAELDFDEYG